MRVIKDAVPIDQARGLLDVFENSEYRRIEQVEENRYHQGEKYSCSYHRSKDAEKHPLFLEVSKLLVRYVSDLGDQALMYAYKMLPGDHFRIHDDVINGTGFVYYLC